MHLADREFELSPLNVGFRLLPDRPLFPLATAQMRRKVCIMGAGLYKHEAEDILNDPEWEVWTLNLCPSFDRQGRLRVDRWFDLHQRVAQTADDMRWIAKCPVPIYVPDDLLDASPNAIPYPIEAVEAAFGSYWACTFAYQIALVMWEGIATDLALYGVELAFGTARERTVEWANVAYWVGRAEERGLTLHLPSRSTIASHKFRYGLEYTAELESVKVYANGMDIVENPLGALGGQNVGG